MDASDVYRILTKMNVKKSVGNDDIPCKFLKIGTTPPAGILCQMVNISLNECSLWESFWKSIVYFLRPDFFRISIWLQEKI